MLIFTSAFALFLIHKMSALTTIRQLVKDITSLSNSLSDSVPQGSKDDKIYCVMNTEEHNTPHETFNRRFDVLFAEDCRDSHGRLHLVRQGKLGMGLVVSYLSKINWSTGFPLDLVELKLQRLVTELKGLQYVPHSINYLPSVFIDYFIRRPRPVRPLNLTAKLKDSANTSAPELSFQRKAVQDYRSRQTAVPQRSQPTEHSDLPPSLPLKTHPPVPRSVDTASTLPTKRTFSSIAVDSDGEDQPEQHRGMFSKSATDHCSDVFQVRQNMLPLVIQ